MSKEIITKEGNGNIEKFLQKLIDSKKLPTHVKTVEEAFAIRQMGEELGFATMQSFHYIIPVQGKLSLSAKATGALLRKGGVQFQTLEDGVYVYEDGTTSEYKDSTKKPIDIRTKIRFVRDGMEEITSFSWKDAEGMGLTGKENWKKMPKFMLFARCLSAGANRIGSDLLLGLYTTEELFDHMAEGSAIVNRNEEGEIIEIVEEKK